MKILLVDDEKDIRKSLSNFIKKLGHMVYCAENGKQGLELFNTESFDMVVTDMCMPEMDGLELMSRIMKIRKSIIDIIVITGHGDMENAIKALRMGAYDYLQKPIDVRELAIVINRSMEYKQLRKKYSKLKDSCGQGIESKIQTLKAAAAHYRDAYFKEVGLADMQIYSEEMRQVANLAEKYGSDRSMPVLIEGESGTGKELISRRIHHSGTDAESRPFVAINCGAISQELFEGELFGHEGGAYTGATLKGRIGKLESANGGTVFFDEIGEMPMSFQVKLLRVLESWKLYHVGGTKEIPIDLRIISATNKELVKEVEAGRFRLDLYHRISMGIIRIPSLRERTEDIIPLAYHFARSAFARRGKKFNRFSTNAKAWLKAYPWPGNVRQLKNIMQRVSLLSSKDCLDIIELTSVMDHTPSNTILQDPKNILGKTSFILPSDELNLEAFTFEIIRQALEKHGNNRTKTAQFLGISRRMLQGRMKKMGL